MSNFIVVLFKNKERKKIIKKFITLDKANSFYTNLIKKSQNVIFERKFENGKDCEYELGLIQHGKSKDNLPTYVTDELGRNIRVKLIDEDYTILKISKYKVEESIFDLEKNKKIGVDTFIKNYLKTDTLKVISVLNNKIVVQKDETIKVFSLKNEMETIRFVDSISKHFFINKRNDCLFVSDTSTPQKKYLLELLENNGFDKKIFYRKFTTHPRS